MIKNSVINIEISDDIEQSLLFAQSYGFEFIEIQKAWGKHVEQLEDSDLAKLKELINDHGLKVSCISSTLFLRCYLDDRNKTAPEVRGFDAIGGNYNDHLRMLEKAIKAANILEAPFVRVFGFTKIDEVAENVFQMAAENFIQPIEVAKKAGSILVLENCPHTSFGWGINAVKLLKMIDTPNMRLLWDPAGAVRAGEPDCIQALPEILDLVAHVHAKDISGITNGKGEYHSIGKGKVPWKTILQALNNHGYDGAVSIEPHFLGIDGTKGGAVLESKQAINKLLEELNE